MTKQEKVKAIEDLKAQLAENQNIYLTDVSDLDALATSNLRRACFKAGIKLTVVKNTLLAKAFKRKRSVHQKCILIEYNESKYPCGI